MRDIALKTLVTEACECDRWIAKLNDKLRGMKQRLIIEAESRPDDQTPTDGGGWSIVFEGVDGNVARVTKPGDALKPAIDGEGRAIEKIRQAAGSTFARLFQQAPKWKLADNFRVEAASLLGRNAARLIKLCTKHVETKVFFETKDSQP